MDLKRDTVILVNERDEWIGTMDKLEAHREGILHRAISVFIFNDRKELLLQRRAAGKYHSAGLWTNTCCSHPMPGESTLSAAGRRLQEEMGFSTALQPVFDLRYKADVGDGLTENEFDHIFIGSYSADVRPDPAEVSEARFFPLDFIDSWMTREPQVFTAWFHLALPKIVAHIRQQTPA